ncbi:Glutaredoxin domain-containing protein [Mycena sanguinolenta]|uniref:Glutaredoxin domain-containing protein n=1 Tax=Mycena sanguinolenta TaxID=230812 RepID=A0A8H7DJK0_9AGAR|nr:Glutaredoxin domain-containing protein [Mycena sanguinolenta]
MPGHTSLRHRSTSSVSLPLAVVARLHPKRHRNRTAVLALLAIISLSAFVFCNRYPVAMSSAYLLRQGERQAEIRPAEQKVFDPEKSRNSHVGVAKKHQKLSGGRKSITLNLEQELAAVSSFLASLPQNVIPLSVDPSLPIDPELVLDFDTRSPRALAEVEQVVEDVWSRNPVLLYGKHYSPATREIKSILSNMNLRPPPFIMDVDTRDDVEVLSPMLSRLTGVPDLPILLIGGKPVGSLERIREMLASGELTRLIKASGAVIGGGKRRKHGK